MTETLPLDSDLTATLEGMSPEEAAVIAKERAVREELKLGETFINAHRGRLWDQPEARPYLQARMALACLLERAGKLKEARSHFEALLRFTPSDPQEVRYHLAACQTRLGDLKALQSLLKTFASDSGPVWLWMTLLSQVRTGQEKTALKTLARARRANPHIEPFLTGKVRLPRSAPREAAEDSPEAAVAAMAHLGPAWSADREAMYWLLRVGEQAQDS